MELKTLKMLNIDKIKTSTLNCVKYVAFLNL